MSDNKANRQYRGELRSDGANLSYTVVLRLIKVINAVLMTVPFAVAWYVIYNPRILGGPFYEKGNWLVVFLFFVLYCVFAKTYDALLVSYNRVPEMVYSQMLSVLFTDVLMFLIIWILTRFIPVLWPFPVILAAQFGISVLWSFFSHRWYFRTFRPKHTIVVRDMRKDVEDLVKKYRLEKKYDIIGTVLAEDCVTRLSILDYAEVVFLAGVHSHDRNIIIKYCVEHDITALIIPRIGDVLMASSHRMHLFHLPILRLDRYDPPVWYVLIKRVCDIVLSIIAIVILSPVMAVAALLIRQHDKGPVLYRQKRLTKDGREFMLMKFRSMKVDAEDDGIARLSTEEDERITPIGRVIRRFRIDEIPQMFNILKGDMTIVGPRPERPEIAALYEKELPEFKLRLQAKAGLTGYAQVYGKYDTTPYDKLQMDLMYISTASIPQDISIIFATIKILFQRESTEGVKESPRAAETMGMDKYG